MAAEQISENVWKVNADSNIFIIRLKNLVIIDAGNAAYKDQIIKDINSIIDPSEVEAVIFTHLHYDHIGCFDLFSNARFYASKQEIKNLRDNALGTVLEPALAARISKMKLDDITGLGISEFEVINSPGHTAGSICIRYGNILFTGDTKFQNGYGRTDLPTSVPEKMDETLEMIEGIEYDILCPGHDY